MGAEWIEDLVDGWWTLMRMGLINLDLMDLRAIVDQTGEATMLVGVGRPDDPRGILEAALKAPLAAMDVGGAKGCLIQVEGGLGMTIGQVDAVADLFTSALDAGAQVILGARVSEDLVDTMRVVTLLAGIRPSWSTSSMSSSSHATSLASTSGADHDTASPMASPARPRRGCLMVDGRCRDLFRVAVQDASSGETASVVDCSESSGNLGR